MRGSRVESLIEARRNRYVALESLNFVWDHPEIEEFERMWKEGLAIEDMAKEFDRDEDEVAILAMDRCRLGRIEQRAGGVNGRRMPDGA